MTTSGRIEYMSRMHRVGTTSDSSKERVTTAVESNGQILLRYFSRRTATASDAADLLGETFLVIWRRASSMPYDDDQSRMWMFGIARRVLSTHRRSSTRRHAAEERLRDDPTASALARANGAAATSTDDLADHVRLLVNDLDEIDRELITLVHWEGLTIYEAAALLGRNPSSMRSRYSRTKERLYRALTESGDIV